MQPITVIGSNDKKKNNTYAEHYEKVNPYAYAYDGRSAVGSQQYCPTGNVGQNIRKRKKQHFDLSSILSNITPRNHNNKVNNKQNFTSKYRTLGIVTSMMCIMTLFMNWAYYAFFTLIPIDMLLGTSVMETEELWYPLITTVLGVASIITYMRFDNIRLYKLITSIGIIAVCIMTFKKIIGLDFAVPGLGLIVCLVSGIILLVLPFVECKASIKNMH